MLRRTVLATSAVAALAMGACGDDDRDASLATTSAGSSVSSPPSSSAPTAGSTGTSARGTESPWSFVDGSGTETTLDAMPTRIVAHAAAAAALIPLGIRPVGIYADGPVEEDLALKDVDLSGIEIVGEEWGAINLEAVAALDPDLIVAEYWPVEQAYSGMEPGAATAGERMREIAPVLGVAQGPSIATMIDDYGALAEALGADLDAPEITAAAERFERSLTAFQAAVEARPGLSVLAVSPSTDGLYVAVPEHAAELSDFVSWGLDVVVPDSPDEGFEYWETLSWENAAKYQADLVIVDERSWPENLEQAEAQPTWSTLEAVAAEAVSLWPAFWVRNHDDYAAALDRLTDAIETADPDLVP